MVVVPRESLLRVVFLEPVLDLILEYQVRGVLEGGSRRRPFLELF